MFVFKLRYICTSYVVLVEWNDILKFHENKNVKNNTAIQISIKLVMNKTYLDYHWIFQGKIDKILQR